MEKWEISPSRADTTTTIITCNTHITYNTNTYNTIINVVVPSELQLQLNQSYLMKYKQLVMALMGEHCLAFG